jgi:hypothetical protein
MPEQPQDLKAAYARLEEAIDDVTRLEGFEGIRAEWVVVCASQRFDDDGDGITQVGTLQPDGGGHVPYHRSMGLLDYALTRMRAEIARDDD